MNKPPGPRRLRAGMIAMTLVFAAVCPRLVALEIFYLRHGETGGNVKKAWESVPKEEWPAYVGNSGVFTPKGLEQVARVPGKLEAHRFDHIAVSPIWRARHTILPYLQKHERKAEVWPALAEFGTQAMKDALKKVAIDRAPGAELWSGGSLVKLPKEELAHFTVAEGLRLPKIAAEAPQNVADVRALADHMVETLRARFGGTDQTVLLVGHGNNGRVLLEQLTGGELPPLKAIKNTALWVVKEQPDGRFKLTLYNDESL